MKGFKAAVLGPIPRDHITTHRGEVIEKYGCATHTAIGMSRLLGDNGEVHLISHVRKADKPGVLEILSPTRILILKGSGTVLTRGDVIQLKFVDRTIAWKNRLGL